MVSFLTPGQNKDLVNQIKDRNGNYITVNHNSSGDLTSITDTLGRVVTVNYSGGSPSTITQTWKNNNGAGSNVTYTHATFSYVNKTVTPSFHSSLSILKPIICIEDYPYVEI